MSAKVWLVDDDVSMRESLGFLLRTLEYDVADFADVASFDAAAQAEDVLRGCLLLDEGNVSALAAKSQRYLLLTVIIMTSHVESEASLRASYSGAFAFFSKPVEIEPLLESLHQAMHESEQRWQSQQALQARFALLSAREKEVMQLMVAGQTNKEIARALSLSSRTITTHRTAVRNKLGISDLAALVAAWQQLNPE